MKRRTRSSLSLSRGASARAPLICLAAALGLTAVACSSDLFHDTKWQSRCDLDPDAPICPQGTGGASGTSSASTTGGAGGNSSTSTTSGGGGGASGSTTGTTSSATAASSSTG